MRPKQTAQVLLDMRWAILQGHHTVELPLVEHINLSWTFAV